MKELTQSQTILHKKEPIHYLNGFRHENLFYSLTFFFTAFDSLCSRSSAVTT